VIASQARRAAPGKSQGAVRGLTRSICRSSTLPPDRRYRAAHQRLMIRDRSRCCARAQLLSQAGQTSQVRSSLGSASGSSPAAAPAHSGPPVPTRLAERVPLD